MDLCCLKPIGRLLIASLILLIPIASNAVVVVTDYYRLGEHDPGAVLLSVAGSTQDSSGNPVGANILLSAESTPEDPNAPKYETTFGSSANVKLGSTFAGYFDTVNTFGSRFQTAQPSTLAADNFGIEGWFFPESSSPTQGLVYNGISESRGFGLFIRDNTYQGYIAGAGFLDTGVAVSTTDWFYFAMVRDGGVIRLYVNGTTPVASFTGLGATIPAQGTDSFVIGNNKATGLPGGVIEHRYNGSVDELRVFEFGGGQFQAESDLLYNVPEPSGFLALSVGGTLIAGWKRDRKRKGA